MLTTTIGQLTKVGTPCRLKKFPDELWKLSTVITALHLLTQESELKLNDEDVFPQACIDIKPRDLLLEFTFSNFMNSTFYLAQHASLTSVRLVKMFRFRSLCSHLFILVLGVFAFSVLTLIFMLFTHKLCLEISELRMRDFTRNRFPIKKLQSLPCLRPLWRDVVKYIYIYIYMYVYTICACSNHCKKM